MTITKTLGGNRLGSGAGIKIDLKAYERSNHNLSYDWKSSMQVGTLVPFMKILALNGDTFDIDLNALVKTKPTIAPLYGSMKLQLDLFSVPIRLYQAILHNNPLSIGMNMNKVFLPKMILETNVTAAAPAVDGIIGSSHLLKYLGISGIGSWDKNTDKVISRSFNAVPLLAYYDIFKCYYANKQEKNAYVINNKYVKSLGIAEKWRVINQSGTIEENYNDTGDNVIPKLSSTATFAIKGKNIDSRNIFIDQTEFGGVGYKSVDAMMSNSEIIALAPLPGYDITFKFAMREDAKNVHFYVGNNEGERYPTELIKFPLSNIDDMRYDILSFGNLGDRFNIKRTSPAPYGIALDIHSYKYPQSGLCVKTYQSDLFNNWLNSETIDGLNGITQKTAIDTSSGSFTIDALNLAQKIYTMQNLIAASGGTYEDWQEARYGIDAMRKSETPMYEGGASYEIGFEEVVSTADTYTEAAGDQPLGSLAGKGQIFDKKGGKVTIKVKEPSYIIGIASITPRITYSQGNDWDMYSIDTLEDLHAPELDQIGFQDLIQEQMAFWTTHHNDTNLAWEQKSAGKQPAWVNYMTAVSKVYGDFADATKAGFMVLDRKYERLSNEDGDNTDEIKDLTTYIDPKKYNYAFASTAIEEQNFWVQIAANITARRKMSAKVMPTI